MKGNIRNLVITLPCAVVISLAVACSGEKKPEGILSRPEMVQVLQEVYLAEEKINRLGIGRDSAKEVFAVMEKMVFEDAEVGDSVFQRSFDYYMEHPKEMELIYTALVDTLQLKEQRVPYQVQQP